MKWDEGHESPDVIDRRGERSGPAIGGGFIWLLLRFKYGWVIVLLILGAYFVQQHFSGSGTGTTTSSHAVPANDTQARFVGFVLDDAQKFWDGELPKYGLNYRHAKLVLFTDRTPTACGLGEAATGPFYCPNDERVYIDLGFFRVLESKLGAHGDFARAYVVAHEIGHHVQKIEGHMNQGGRGPALGASGNSVRTELQADCYAGVWAHSAQARGELEPGDIESALDAASRIGDDVLQREETGVVRPESFTHGTAAQRRNWLSRGFKSGDMRQCDTFSATQL